MAYLGTQPNDVKKNTGLYTPSEILQLTKDGSWGGSLELIEEQTVSGSPSSINFINLANNPYDVYMVQFKNIITSTQQQIIYRFSNDNGTTFEAGASAYQYASFRITASGGTYQNRSSGNSYIGTDAYTNTSNSNYNSYVYLYNLLNSSKYSFLTHQSASLLTAGSYRSVFGGGVYPTAETINGFQLLTSGTLTSGTAKLYGVKQL